MDDWSETDLGDGPISDSISKFTHFRTSSTHTIAA